MILTPRISFRKAQKLVCSTSNIFLIKCDSSRKLHDLLVATPPLLILYFKGFLDGKGIKTNICSDIMTTISFKINFKFAYHINKIIIVHLLKYHITHTLEFNIILSKCYTNLTWDQICYSHLTWICLVTISIYLMNIFDTHCRSSKNLSNLTIQLISCFTTIHNMQVAMIALP